jgi:hypothetical protein
VDNIFDSALFLQLLQEDGSVEAAAMDYETLKGLKLSPEEFLQQLDVLKQVQDQINSQETGTDAK